ncbi:MULTISPECIES: ABC transporter ATP-binding protein [Breznakia]|uniref:Spermidine/putrescine import ATP-binding protein PotA n=1 Tax=Breznakia blatticola TaxID=1754012 RepID=A0A4R8A8P2_9FIRM|nr:MULTISPECIES: ABC transporter ATP-binding protein [Breznakia]MDH6366905.1 spermidine/putrescine transport system ATP-binding protein [Breznakia sp. PH1-1]MDH6404083.1 spermidine/putrescine transport system ATP-binding protein [Breznakia sp. PF1-11]MDH6411792.1 spermidine/putrescine transport system ATP-binding protein [Breznakia sp. PFB1-11]MDH6414071.1 spermidine/putrescine transport system ATP-binding protein [Breznakia sp. PFB1-14]MDH6416572.1 spermidine/putrescine transport system ATP-b
MNKIIQFKNIVKSFDDQVILKGITLDIYENEFVTLLGPSGCGKTTLLRILGGFLEADSGEVIFDNENIADLPPYKRELNTVFQKYALFPHMNVFDNIAFGLKIKKMSDDVIRQKVTRMLKLVNLEGYEDRKIDQLSGGQQQRIAIARALVNEPKVLLLDEPLGALDLKLRKEMQLELKKIQQEVGITFIYVTHDQEEALTMSDKIVVMREGEIEQVGTPVDIYNEPVNEYVANFIGESNVIDGVMKEDYLVSFDDKDYTCVDHGFKENEEVDIVIRPEDIEIVGRGRGVLNGKVKSMLFKGVHNEIIVETARGSHVEVTMTIYNKEPIFNEDAGEYISANNFYVDVQDFDELTDDDIIARADAQAWDAETEEYVGFSNVTYEELVGEDTYPVTFSTSKGTSITIQMIGVKQRYIQDEKKRIGIAAFDFFKTLDEIEESQALDTDLKTWADAVSWDLDTDEAIEVRNVDYDFEIEDLKPGKYKVSFSTVGREFKIHTTKSSEVDKNVGLSFGPEDIHVMEKMGF